MARILHCVPIPSYLAHIWKKIVLCQRTNPLFIKLVLSRWLELSPTWASFLWPLYGYKKELAGYSALLISHLHLVNTYLLFPLVLDWHQCCMSIVMDYYLTVQAHHARYFIHWLFLSLTHMHWDYHTHAHYIINSHDVFCLNLRMMIWSHQVSFFNITVFYS